MLKLAVCNTNLLAVSSKGVSYGRVFCQYTDRFCHVSILACLTICQYDMMPVYCRQLTVVYWLFWLHFTMGEQYQRRSAAVCLADLQYNASIQADESCIQALHLKYFPKIGLIMIVTDGCCLNSAACVSNYEPQGLRTCNTILYHAACAWASQYDKHNVVYSKDHMQTPCYSTSEVWQ